jgi:hypothetical protein
MVSLNVATSMSGVSTYLHKPSVASSYIPRSRRHRTPKLSHPALWQSIKDKNGWVLQTTNCRQGEYTDTHASVCCQCRLLHRISDDSVHQFQSAAFGRTHQPPRSTASLQRSFRVSTVCRSVSIANASVGGTGGNGGHIFGKGTGGGGRWGNGGHHIIPEAAATSTSNTAADSIQVVMLDVTGDCFMHASPNNLLSQVSHKSTVFT